MSPLRSACSNLYYFSCKIEVHRIDIPATRLARGNHLGGLSFFFGVGGSGRRPVESADPGRGSRRVGQWNITFRIIHHSIRVLGGRGLRRMGRTTPCQDRVRAAGRSVRNAPRTQKGKSCSRRSESLVFGGPGGPEGVRRAPFRPAVASFSQFSHLCKILLSLRRELHF